jgi:hypothetical protein
MAHRVAGLTLVLSVSFFAAACGGGSPAGPSSTGSGSTGGRATTAPPATGPLAYTQDIKPLLDSDCLSCHSNNRRSGGYSVQTYAEVMRAVTAGNASSLPIRVTQPGGARYGELNGDRAGKAAGIRRWIVDSGAAENR